MPWPSPTNADRTRLQPAYDRASDAIRREDAGRLLFFAGVTWDDAGPGFSAPPGGDEFANRSVLAYHYYQPPQVSTKLQVEAQLAGARRLKTGVFITETGGATGPLKEGLWDVADDTLTSWAFWAHSGGYKAYCRESDATRAGRSQEAEFGACKFFAGSEDSCCRNHTDESFGWLGVVRPYASAVAGATLSMRYHAWGPRARTFELMYEIDPALPLPTELRVPPPDQNASTFLTYDWHAA